MSMIIYIFHMVRLQFGTKHEMTFQKLCASERATMQENINVLNQGAKSTRFCWNHLNALKIYAKRATEYVFRKLIPPMGKHGIYVFTQTE